MAERIPPEQAYTERLAGVRLELENAYGGHSGNIQLLIGLGLAAILILWFAANTHAIPMFTAALVLIPGALVARRFGRTQAHVRQLRMLIAWYERALGRMKQTWTDDPETGEQYADADHLYSGDLDLFGRGSLFQLMCISRTSAGRDRLAEWMTAPVPLEDARRRTAAVEELRGRMDLREAVAASGPNSFSDCRTEVFTEWLDAPVREFPQWARLVAPILAVGVPVMAVLTALRVIPFETAINYALGWIAAEGAFSSLFRDRVLAVIGEIGMPSVDLSILADMIGIFEKQKFESAKLGSLTEALHAGGAAASRRIAQLRRLITLLDQRKNEVFSAFSWLLLWGTQFAMAIEKWREQNGKAMQEWLNAMAEFEALNAVSCYAFEHPDDVPAEFTGGTVVFDAEGLSHPLLNAASAIRNDVRLRGETPLWIVSGSNMSGKSTLLRACGLAVVLASMGAPIRARRLRLSHLSLAAAIRLQDSLLDGRSRFYAEIARLKATIDLAEKGPLLFLVDEILGGTNCRIAVPRRRP